MQRPERVLLLRSGRHLQVALETLKQTHPGCHVTVIATPGTDSARQQANINATDWITYDAHPQFDAWPMFRSGLAARLWARGFDRVAVLWQDPEGSDRANVDRTATLLSPRGFVAITPDGTLVQRRSTSFVLREVRTLIQSAIAATVLGLALYFPAVVIAQVRGQRHRAAR